MFRKFFKGWYGIDTLTYVLFIGAVLLIKGSYTWYISVVLLATMLFRIISRNKTKRYRELQAFNGFIRKISQSLMPKNAGYNRNFGGFQRKAAGFADQWRQRKQYVFMKCPKCKKKLRVPRNKGRIIVTCPVCKLEFMKKT